MTESPSVSLTPLALTPEQIAAFAAGQTVVYAVDPVTKRRYRLIDEEPQQLSLEELRGMLQEAVDSSERGECKPWDPEEIKEEIRRSIARNRAQA